MKKLLLTAICFALFAICGAAQTPDVRIHTNIYASEGATNSFTLVLGAAVGHEGYADVVCSGGNQSEAELAAAYYDEESGALVGTNISCQVNEEGVVEVYCDEGVLIDYLSCEGAEITSIEFKNPEAVEILALEHNSLAALDLSAFTSLTALYLNDNPFDGTPFLLTGEKPNLTILELDQIENLDPAFDISAYPSLQVFDAMSTHGLTRLSPAACPNLMKLSIDNTAVSELDVTGNPNLYVLNISETRIRSIDLSACTKLQQFYCTHTSAYNADVKLTEIDLSKNADLIYLFLSGNRLTSLDVSACTALQDLYVRDNLLQSLDLSHNPDLVNVMISGNRMDFTTLPIPQDTWGSYEYAQAPLEVPVSHLAGSKLDLSARLCREDMPTYCALFTVSREDPATAVQVDDECFTFADGVLEIPATLGDSVYASFYNGTFPDIELTTTRFLVKTSDTFGKPDLAATIGSTLTAGKSVEIRIGMQGADAEPKTFFIDLGDGTLQTCTASTEATPSEANVLAEKPRFGAMKVYVPEGEKLTALSIDGMPLTSIDLTSSTSLHELSLTSTGLKDIDLQWNRCLERLTLRGNEFGANLDLSGANGYYGKNILTHIDLAQNAMTSVQLPERYAIQHLDLSENALTEIDLTDAENLQYLNLSQNALTDLKLGYCSSLQTCICSDNAIASVVMPETNVLQTFDIRRNRFTFASMPDRGTLDEANFLYAPQKAIVIPTKGPGYNLSAQAEAQSGHAVQFQWLATDGQPLTEGTDYTCEGGITHFLDASIGRTLFCRMTCPEYPAFSGDDALATTEILSAGMPTHLLGSFTTPTGGQEVTLSLTSNRENNTIFIDWTGTQSLEQYQLALTYTVFSATTTAGAKVKVWSYDEDDGLTVFSITGATMASVDLSPMRNLIMLAVNEAGISTIQMPESPNMTELKLEGNAFTTFPFASYPQLQYVSFANNRFRKADISALADLRFISFAGNLLTSFQTVSNPNLWGLVLTGNEISSVDLAGSPNLSQLSLNENQLSAIDLSPLTGLRVLYLDGNRFDFSNLPVPQDQWTLYTYGNQPTLSVECVDGKVDLSAQAERDGVATQFTWYYDYPEEDADTGELTGEELLPDVEYILTGGVTTFCTTLDKVVGVLTNELFPDLALQTNLIAVAPPAGIEAVEAPAANGTADIYTLSGIRVTQKPQKGVYIQGGKKFVVK